LLNTFATTDFWLKKLRRGRLSLRIFCYDHSMNVVFLDRDGTVIVDPKDERVDTHEKIELFHDSIAALTYLAENDFAVVFITNQAGIAEGRITEDDFWRIHNEVLRRLEPSGVKILKTYVNGEAAGPHTTEWRKPGPNMLLQAAEDLDLALANIYMVGDSESDIQAAFRAGCKGGVLVETATNKKVVSPEAVHSAPNLMDAVHFVVND
jgi:histidinol-phosphate phosphatase family protein